MNRKVYSFLLPLTVVILAACHPLARYFKTEDIFSWEPDIQVFDSLNLVEASDENTVLVTGSSSVRLWDSVHVNLAPYRVMQRGYGGAKMTDYNHYAERIIKPQTFKAIIFFVVNDITGGEYDKTPREVFRLFKTLVHQIRERNPDTPVFWIETTPTPSRWIAIDQIREANALVKHYCEKNPDLYFIETYDAYLDAQGTPDSTFFRQDMLHMNQDGYDIWSQKIKAALLEAEILP